MHSKLIPTDFVESNLKEILAYRSKRVFSKDKLVVCWSFAFDKINIVWNIAT